MKDLTKLKKTFDDIGVFYKETIKKDYTMISPCNPMDVDIPINEFTDRYYEFDEDGDLASYP